MNLGQNFSGFLGRSWSGPARLMGESTAFAKKVIGRFCSPGVGCNGGGGVRVCGGPVGG